MAHSGMTWQGEGETVPVCRAGDTWCCERQAKVKTSKTTKLRPPWMDRNLRSTQSSLRYGPGTLFWLFPYLQILRANRYNPNESPMKGLPVHLISPNPTGPGQDDHAQRPSTRAEALPGGQGSGSSSRLGLNLTESSPDWSSGAWVPRESRWVCPPDEMGKVNLWRLGQLSRTSSASTRHEAGIMQLILAKVRQDTPRQPTSCGACELHAPISVSELQGGTNLLRCGRALLHFDLSPPTMPGFPRPFRPEALPLHRGHLRGSLLGQEQWQSGGVSADDTPPDRESLLSPAGRSS